MNFLREIGFLKVDCEGGVLSFASLSPAEVLATLGLIALEIHKRSPCSKTDLTEYVRGLPLSLRNPDSNALAPVYAAAPIPGSLLKHSCGTLAVDKPIAFYRRVVRERSMSLLVAANKLAG